MLLFFSSRLRKVAAFAAIMVAVAVGSGALVTWVHGASDPGIAETLASIDDVIEKPADMDSALRMLRQVRTELARERSARMQAERRSSEPRKISDMPRGETDAARGIVREACVQPTADEIRPIKLQKPDAVYAIVVGGSNVSFYKQMKAAAELPPERPR